MNKILLIIQREYLSRVKKKSFIIMAILGPLLFGGIFAMSIWLSVRDSETRTIKVIDESGLFADKLKSTGSIIFVPVDIELEEAKKNLREDDAYGFLYIPKLDVNNPFGIAFFSVNNPGLDAIKTIERLLKTEIEEIKLSNSGLDRATIEGLKTSISITTINLTETGEKKGSTELYAGIGYLASFFIYIFVFLYGAQVMRGVMEEKSNRIVEVIISSVKPFELMMGKIIGIALVALTQFGLWIALTIAITTSATLVMGGENMSPEQMEAMQTMPIGASGSSQQALNMASDSDMMSMLGTVDFTRLIICFIFYFIGGYLLYAALFATVGSAVESDADSQQFMLPISIPLIGSIVMLGAVLKDPGGNLAFWMSMIPLTSPVVMMMRVPFGVPLWELALSMTLLIAGFVFTTYIAARVYRVAILVHGTKVSYKVLAKWFFQKN